ncbi:MFS transporter [Haloactinomyces albus]|uniref:MFS family permease n=1 Tax=Haloactinomyces albus TaxID=1352928 RepID=A0AAE3ZJ23_9ACTN|nr:MFS transporter [Haloactinomyces albus]MDR7304102.1 MFS family permease [Haloactinomyces albus]
MHKTTRITVVLLFAAWTVDYIDRLVVNLALPAIGDTFDLAHGERGLIISAFFLTYALCQIPGGLLADRFGGVRMACSALALWSVFTGLTAAAWSFVALLAVRCCFGAAQGLFPGAALNTLSARSVPEQRMTANGWMQSSNAIGGLLAALLASALLTAWNWRVMYVTVSVLGVLVLLAVVRWMPAPLPPEQTGQMVRRARGATAAVLRSPVMWGFALLFFSYDVVIWGLNSWSASYLVEQRGLEIRYAGLLAIAPTLAAAVGAVVGGRLSDRFEGRPRKIIVPAMVVVAVLLFLLPRTPSVATYVVCGTLLSGAAGLCYLPSFSVPLRSLPPKLSGVASGMILFGGQLSGIITPTVFGTVVDHFSYTAAFSVLITGPVLAIVAVLCVPQTTERFLSRFRHIGTNTKEDIDARGAEHRV